MCGGGSGNAPDATIFSVSQNDWRNPCTCEKCRELDEREGGHMGTMLTFVNAVAEAIENEAPHVAIDTLAYQYTRKPPKTLRPRPNVIIRLCSIECCFAHPLESDCAVNQEFADDIRGWSKIADRLYVWDYVTNFHNYMMPWPNFNVLADNVRFFADHSVVGLFEQGSYADGGGGEAAELRAYVLAKLLWDPSADPIAARDEFIEGVYGNAAGFVKLYHDLYHEPVAGDDVHLHIFCDVDNPHITEEVLRRGDALLTQAEAAAESREVRERVEVAHLPVQYAMIRTMDADDPARKELLDHFLAICERGRIQAGQRTGDHRELGEDRRRRPERRASEVSRKQTGAVGRRLLSPHQHQFPYLLLSARDPADRDTPRSPHACPYRPSHPSSSCAFRRRHGDPPACGAVVPVRRKSRVSPERRPTWSIRWSSPH